MHQGEHHACLMFTDLIDEDGQAVQANQFLVIDHGVGAIIDPASKILFTGDLGVSLMSGSEARTPVRDLRAHIPRMEAFHRRYMVSNKILRLWANMARQLEVRKIVPQHGAPIVGSQAIREFFDWVEGLQCGIDLFEQANYRLPTARIDTVTGRSNPLLRVA